RAASEYVPHQLPTLSVVTTACNGASVNHQQHFVRLPLLLPLQVISQRRTQPPCLTSSIYFPRNPNDVCPNALNFSNDVTEHVSLEFDPAPGVLGARHLAPDVVSKALLDA